MTKTIGILGGMGPEATAYFFELIIKNTRAAKDKEHIPVLIYSNPKIPPRTEAILGKGKSPLPFLLEGVKILREAGADFIAMPCITAHYYYRKIVAREKIPFLSLLEETRLYVRKKFPRIRRVGLIATTGTVQSELFQEAFERNRLEIVLPRRREQEQVMEAVYGANGIKAGFSSGYPRQLIHSVARKLIQRGAEAVIAGCTEIPLVLKAEDLRVPLIEPMEIGALACIKKAGYKIKAKSEK